MDKEDNAVRDVNAVNREDNEVVSAVDRVHAAVKSLSAATPGQFDLTIAPQATHVRMRTSALVLAPTAAGIMTLTIGLKTWAFSFAAVAVPVVLPFYEKVDRGVDIFMNFGVAAPGMAYLIYTPE